jgi:hypothetical protein
MPSLNLRKLQVKYIGISTPEGPSIPRRYTLTHSDQTGDLFLSIGTTYDQNAIAGWYTRLMRDEVLAEYRLEGAEPILHVHCHVSGGLVFGFAGWRYRIFVYHLPGVLEAFRYGDTAFLSAHPCLEQAPIRVHFHSIRARYRRVEDWGSLQDYKIFEGHNET